MYYLTLAYLPYGFKRIEVVGKYADFCVLNKDLRVEQTIIEGKIIKKMEM